MRLQQLDLVRYGKFTGRSLDFGGGKAGEPDFHLIYGPNEAGKSTLFSGFLDLLFGIERMSPYGFLHPYQTMRIGGIVEAGGKRHHAYRIKRNANSLVGPDEQPLPDNLFSAALGAMDRDTYRMMFSLDDDSIEEGGEAILKSEGELGSLLFSASSGLPDSSAVLANLRTEADAFFRPQARKHQLAELKAELDALKSQRKAVDVNAREYADLRKTLTKARERHDAASRQRAELRVRRDRLRAELESLPLLARLNHAREQLAGSEALPVPPEVWWSDLPALRRQEVEIATRLRQMEEELAQRRAELEELPRDEQALALAGRFEALRDSALDARYQTAARDMPARLDELARTSAEIRACLIRLGEADNADPISLVLPTARAARLQELVRRHAGLSEKLASAREELESARRDRARSEHELDRLKGGVADTGLLVERLHVLRQSDCLLRQQAATREIDRLEAALADAMDSLRPFAGDADELATLPVPAPGVVATWRTEEAAFSERRLRLDDRIADERERQAGDEARLAAMVADGAAVDDPTAGELRRRRDLAWQLHRSNLDDGTARAFETALREDDAAVALRLAYAERVAEMRGLTLALSERRARLQALETQRAAVSEESQRLETTVAAAASASGSPNVKLVSQLEAWLATRAAALALRADLRAERQTRDRASSEEQAATRALREELLRLGVADYLPGRLDELLVAAEHFVSRAQSASAAHSAAVAQLRRASEALENRETVLAAAEAAMVRWEEEWAEALAATWLAGRADRPPPHEIGPVLAVLQDFDKLMQKKSELDHRIGGMRKDQKSFAEVIADLAREAGEQGDPLALYASLRDRIAAAQRQEERRLDVSSSVARLEEGLFLLRNEERQHGVMRQAILDFFGCGTLEEAGLCLEAVREQERQRQRSAELEQDLVTRLGTANHEEAESILAGLDEPELRLELTRLDEAIDVADRDVSELHSEVRNKERALAEIEGGDRVAELEQRQRTILLDIEHKAVGYLRLKAGVFAAEHALRLFRERHRSAMMQRASRTFSHISGGEYAGLSTQADKGQEFLIANTAAGGSKLAGDLSKGTRFQLYLALRMAGYHEVAAARETLPFIADDIMETFDDNRAGRAFELMAEMARVGQVVYLTHHEHLCDIARSACPGVKLHKL
ncbi:sugar translocase [Sinorhizobium glycinis]|uniref:Sugar translocase n=1 Tax=Sinorhizobium glycinis TaxID=1472378 RepID=A0A178XYS8_9HYPH|nr:AAA family ATPase [Sinorhizobium glycinis]OAP40469.1 sugar translocase [Sinorhizobium glycinis]